MSCMKNNSKAHATRKKINSKPTGIDAPLMKGDLLVIPLGILATITGFNLAIQFQTISQHPQFLQLLSSLAVIFFVLLYAYETFRRHTRSLSTRIMTGILTLLLFLVFLLTLLFTSGGETCASFFGSRTNCIDLQYGVIHLLLFNPYVAPALGFISLVGVVSILTRKRK